MTAFIGLLTQLDAPAARSGTQGRHLFNDPNVKHGTAACAERTSIGTTACASGFGVAFMCVCWAGLGACSGIFSRSSSHGVCAERTTAHDVAPVVTRGTLPIARSNPTSRWGFKRPLRATYFNAAKRLEAKACEGRRNARKVKLRGLDRLFSLTEIVPVTIERDRNPPSNATAAPINAATQTIGVNRAPSLEMVIGVAAPVTTSRSYAGHCVADTGHERDSVVTPARRALGFRPADAGGSFFAMRELMAGAR